jgi:hypothetical protein
VCCRSSDPRKGRGVIFPIIETGGYIVHTREYSRETKFASEMWHRERRLEVSTHASVAFFFFKCIHAHTLIHINAYTRIHPNEPMNWIFKFTKSP